MLSVINYTVIFLSRRSVRQVVQSPGADARVDPQDGSLLQRGHAYSEALRGKSASGNKVCSGGVQMAKVVSVKKSVAQDAGGTL